MVRTVCIISFIYMCSAHAIAQEIWTRSQKYFYEKGDTAVITFQTGEEFIGHPIPLHAGDIASVETTLAGGAVTKADFKSSSKATSFTVRLPVEGICDYIVNLKPRTLRLTGEEFLKYAEQYGVEEVAKISGSVQRTNLISLEKREVIHGFVRSGKEVGKSNVGSPRVLPIRLVTDKNPLLLKKGERVVFTVLKDGAPAFGVKVVIWNRWNNRTTIQHIWTQQDGTVSATISSPGDWMVSVVSLNKGENVNSYVADSFNLVFGYR